MQHAYINNDTVIEILPPFSRTEVDRPAAPPALPEGYTPTPEEQAAREMQQAAHDDYKVGPVPIEERYHPDFLAYVEQVADNVQQGWVRTGSGFAAPQPVAAPVPQSVTMRQARLALLQAGKLADVNDAIVALPSPQREAAQIDWEFAATVERDSATVAMLAQALALDDAALDDLFTTAAGL